MAAVREALHRDAEALAGGGVHALMIENFGDAPFYPGRVPASTVAAMTVLAAEVRAAYALPLGINVLRNDGESALAVAHAVGASFIRVNVLCGARVTDQGLVAGIAHDLLRQRAMPGSQAIQILADVNVKHSSPLGVSRLEDEVADTIERGLADAVVVSGTATGRATDLAEIERVRQAAGSVPLLVGSGVSTATLADYLPAVDAFIVGTAFKAGGVSTNRVDFQRVQQFMQRYEELAAH
jgi:membrane complex biogenesis BtpA family protein